MDAEPAETHAGVVIDGRFRLLRKLGEGGAAQVWQAADLADRSLAAIKILHPHLRLLAEPRRRFAHEAAVLQELAHPSIVRATSFLLEGDRPYIAMEYRDGVPLDQELRSRREDHRYFEEVEVRAIVRDVAEALEHAHTRGVVHRDLKPANILLLPPGAERAACVLDFGLARLLAESDQTTVGRIVGTYRFMSPEQARGERVDMRTDVFSLGLVFYNLLTLERPWGEDTALKDILDAIARGPRPQVTPFRPELDPALDGVVARATAIEAAERYASVRDLAVAAGAIAPKRMLTPAVFAGSTAALAIALVLMAYGLARRGGARHEETPMPGPEAPHVYATTSAPAVEARSDPAIAERDEPPRDEVRRDEVRRDEVQRDEAQRGELQRGDTQRGDVQPETPQPETPQRTAPHLDLRASPKPHRRPAPEKKADAAREEQDPGPIVLARRAIAFARTAPEDAARFHNASERVKTLIATAQDAAKRERWRRMLEIAELSYDHGALTKIVDEVEEP